MGNTQGSYFHSEQTGSYSMGQNTPRRLDFLISFRFKAGSRNYF